MSDAVASNRGITFLTPTYSGDYERFCLQRESMERCGIDVEHIAVVHEEDMPLFRGVKHRHKLRILSTRDVLGAKMERRRRAWRVRRLNYLHWVVRNPVAGWMSQQLVKIAANQWIDTDGIVCLDSDTFFIAPVTAEDFYSGDRLHLFETADNLDCQMAEWLARSMSFLGLSPAGQPLRQYIHHPFVMHRQVMGELQRHIEQKHGRPWMEAMVEAKAFECTTYGAYARNFHGLRLLDARPPRLTLSYWWPDQVERFSEDFLNRVREGNFKVVLIQSNAGRSVREFRELIEEAWAARAAV